MPRTLIRKDPSRFKTLQLFVEASPEGLSYQGLGMPLNFAQMLEEAFGMAKNLLASALYYPYRMIVASSVWVLPSRIFACWGIPQTPDLLLRAGNAFCKR